MLKLQIYQVDAFINNGKSFTGNPAAVIILDEWLDDTILTNIAMENNLSETAYIVKKSIDNTYDIRWFTPTIEVDLCGHATLASSYVVFNYLGYDKDEIIFNSKSGQLKVTSNNYTGYLTLNFPSDSLEEVSNLPEFEQIFSQLPIKTYKGKTDYMLVYQNEQQIRSLQINFSEINKIKARGVIVTSPGENVDFVSRFFGCGCGIDEDPVTGSAHTSLAPYWNQILNKTNMTALQLSARTGSLLIEYLGDRVNISGKCILYLIGEIFINP